MAHRAATFAHGSEFNAFLFAPVREDGNGMLLSVLSALARLDVDPWQEAAKLAQLPGAAAAQRLASLIAALPKGPSDCLDSGLIAKRLVALLPHPARPDVPSGKVAPGNAEKKNSSVVILMLLIVFSLIAVATWSTPTPADGAHAPAAVAIPGQIPSTTLDH